MHLIGCSYLIKPKYRFILFLHLGQRLEAPEMFDYNDTAVLSITNNIPHDIANIVKQNINAVIRTEVQNISKKSHAIFNEMSIRFRNL